MSTKLPANAFETYVSMGPDRSYQALAKKLGVDKRSVVRLAAKEGWAARLARIQEESRAATDKRLVETLQAVREQQLREVRFVRAEILKLVKGVTPDKAVKMAGALNICWKHELFLLGEPSERTEVSLEEITKRELETLLLRDDEEDEWESASEAGDAPQ